MACDIIHLTTTCRDRAARHLPDAARIQELPRYLRRAEDDPASGQVHPRRQRGRGGEHGDAPCPVPVLHQPRVVKMRRPPEGSRRQRSNVGSTPSGHERDSRCANVIRWRLRGRPRVWSLFRGRIVLAPKYGGQTALAAVA